MPQEAVNSQKTPSLFCNVLITVLNFTWQFVAKQEALGTGKN